MLHSTLFLILLMSVVVYHVKCLHRREVVQYILNNKRHRIHRPHFEKLLQISIRKNKNYNPLTARIIFTCH